MPINPAIALGVKGLELPDPLAQYSRVAAIQQAQNQNALAQYQLAAAQREGDVKNRLLGLDPNAPDYIDQVTKLNPALGSELRLRATQQERERRMGEQARAEAFHKNVQSFQSVARDAALNPTDEIVKGLGQKAVTLGIDDMNSAHQKTQYLLSLPMEKRTEYLQQTGSAPPPWEKGGTPTELERLLKQQGLVPPNSPEGRAIANRITVLTTRPERAESGPTVTQIQNPNDPSQMLVIDARTYRGGGIGSPGVIGSSGKTAPAEAARQKAQTGAAQATDILDTLRTAYDELDRRRALPSEHRSGVSNALAYIASTGAGQVVGRARGTPEQTQRDIISSSRNQLLNAIAQATGMTASRLNSNVELRTWLDALTDPTRSIEANRKILENVQKFIDLGGKYSPTKASGRPSGVGADWTLMTDANGNSAWVSPDLKSHVEVGK